MATSLSAGLLGPQEIRQPSLPTTTTPNTTTTTNNPFFNAMDKNFNAATTSLPPMGFTENYSATYITSGDPCLDFFFQVVPNTPSERVKSLLEKAWQQDSLMALKLVAHLRGVRGTGKSDRQGFYASALWLHQNHPKTLALNVGQLANFGYLKDLPEILYRLVVGADVREKAKAAHKLRRRGPRGPKRVRSSMHPRPFATKKTQRRKNKNKKLTKELRVAADIAKGKILAAEAAEVRRKKRVESWTRAVERYNRDSEYRFLHDRVADAFSELLAGDVKNLTDGQLNKISLAAKWCPSLNSNFERSTLLCEAIARRLFPRNSYPEYESVEEAHYVYRVRDRLRKEVLVPLRRALELPEVYMCANQWSTLPYNRVASVAMKNYKEFFSKHDKERFEEYLASVKKGTAKIAAGALLPHEIVADAGNEVAELQWKRMVADLQEKGSLKSCIAVCDVSGSMSGTPMEVCVSLGLLVSELSEEPWKGRVITFSANPEIHRIEGDSLLEKTHFIRTMHWMMNTNFQKVFDKLLEVAVEAKLGPEQMVKRVLVFSDMEFDQASANSWETDYQVICRKFQERGYGEAIPEVVFWNLRDSRSTPVPSTQKGVALVSGFSKNLLKLFLDGKNIASPRMVMETALMRKEYEKLVVFD